MIPILRLINFFTGPLHLGQVVRGASVIFWTCSNLPQFSHLYSYTGTLQNPLLSEPILLDIVNQLTYVKQASLPEVKGTVQPGILDL
jgi:hypothetical protein